MSVDIMYPVSAVSFALDSKPAGNCLTLPDTLSVVLSEAMPKLVF